MMTEKEFKPCLKVLQGIVRQQFSQAEFKSWFATLRHLQPESLMAAILRYGQEDGSGWPATGTLTQFADEYENGQLLSAQAAYDKVRKAISLFGYPDPKGAEKHLGQLTWAAINRCGGWPWFCEMKPNERRTTFSQFRDAYTDAAQTVKRTRVLTDSVRPRITNESAGRNLIEELGGGIKSAPRITEEPS